MLFSYEITPRSAELGGGWRLRLLEDGAEVGGGVFPVPAEDPHMGMNWWNSRSEKDRAHWLKLADSARPVDAYRAFLLAKSHSEALSEAKHWLNSRK